MKLTVALQFGSLSFDGLALSLFLAADTKICGDLHCLPLFRLVESGSMDDPKYGRSSCCLISRNRAENCLTDSLLALWRLLATDDGAHSCIIGFHLAP